MSKNLKGILGVQYGKIGPVVGRKFREENVYSAYQKNVSNPRSEAQTRHRARFRALSTLSHDMACGAIFGFRTAAKGTNLSPRNLFQKTNWHSVTATSAGATSIDYTGLAVSKGGLSVVNFTQPNFDTPLQVVVEFEEFGAPCQRTQNDRAFAYVYCPDAAQGILSEETDLGDGKVIVRVPSLWTGMRVHVWGFVRNQGPADVEKEIPAGECSPSFYCGSGSIS